MEERRLSSDYLYHYTKEKETLKLILKYGFRFNLINEERYVSHVAEKILMQQNFVICFCDIKPEESTYHQRCYGNYSISLTKNWGIRNRVSPVQYAHENSPSISKKVAELKDIYTGLDKSEGMLDSMDDYPRNIVEWLLSTEKLNKNIFSEENIYQAISDNLNSDNQKTFHHLLMLFRNRLVDISHALLTNDAYIRKYSENFKCPKGNDTIYDKILYDEKEWRAVASNKKDAIYEEYHHEASPPLPIKGYLPKNYNLKFNEEEIHEIVVESVDDITEVISHLYKECDFSNPELLIDKIRMKK